MSNLVIVAIPEEDDLVWKISTEKVPHLTLLYLGEGAQNIAKILSFVEHAADTVLNRFSLEVDKRGVLGQDEADVLFFEGWDLPDLRRYRDFLLMENNIATAYHAAQQYPEWQPHLTLGYPKSPAKPLSNDQRFWSVRFDRIAVWTGDYEGPTFDLKKHEYPMEVAMSADSSAVDDILAHYGVKGMKWGFRKSPEAKAAKEAKKIAKADKKFEEISVDTWVKVNNNASNNINARIGMINDSPSYKGKDLNKDPALMAKYNEEMRKMFETEYNRAAKDLGTNKSGTREYFAQVDEDFGLSVGVKDVEHSSIKHAAPAKLTVVRNNTGHISKVMIDTMAQADAFVGDFLEHYGVKGMKWGVRKSDPVPSGEVRVTQKGKKLKTEGGKDIPPHPDATRAATSKQKAKGSGLQSLSNKELKELQTRLNLEKNVRELTVADKQANTNPAARFIKRTLFNSGKQEAQKAANNAASKTVAAMMKAK